jgi:hypothetical protein
MSFTMYQKKILLVLDLNGVFLERIKQKEKKLLLLNPYCPSQPDFKVNGQSCYLRPFVDHFLTQIPPEFDVAIWTSMIEKNAKEIARHLFGKDRKRLQFVWDRQYCSDVRDGKDHSSIKDLNKIWHSNLFNNRWNNVRDRLKTFCQMF